MLLRLDVLRMEGRRKGASSGKLSSSATRRGDRTPRAERTRESGAERRTSPRECPKIWTRPQSFRLQANLCTYEKLHKSLNQRRNTDKSLNLVWDAGHWAEGALQRVFYAWLAETQRPPLLTPQAPPMTMTSSTLSVYGVEVVVSLSPFELSPRPRAGWPRGAETAKGTGFTRRPDAPSLTCLGAEPLQHTCTCSEHRARAGGIKRRRRGQRIQRRAGGERKTG